MTLENNIHTLLELYSDKEKAEVTDYLFEAMEEADIKKTFDLLNLKKILKITKSLKKVDSKAKGIAREFLLLIAA